MKLEKGITGFIDSRKQQKLLRIDTGLLKKCAYACRPTEFNLDKIVEPSASSNYYRLSYQPKRKGQPSLNVVVNRCYPLYVGITTDSEWMQLQFIDLPKRIRTCFDEHFTYLPPEWLTTEFTEEALAALSKTEISEIKYWGVKTYGEVIFNGLD